MRILVAIMSCAAAERSGDNDSLRDTWLKDLKYLMNVDYRFFIGRGYDFFRCDTVPLDVPDEYEHLIIKSQALHAWGCTQNYDFVFKADTDTYVDVFQLLNSQFANHDYSGYLHTEPGAYPHTPYGLLGGGEGYWTSHKACDIIRKAPQSDGSGEDLWTANILGGAGIRMVGLPGYGRDITLHGGVVTNAPRGSYKNNWMYETYANRHNQ